MPARQPSRVCLHFSYLTHRSRRDPSLFLWLGPPLLKSYQHQPVHRVVLLLCWVCPCSMSRSSLEVSRWPACSRPHPCSSSVCILSSKVLLTWQMSQNYASDASFASKALNWISSSPP